MKILNVHIDPYRAQKYSRKLLLNLFLSPFLYPLYFLSHVVPRDRNLWACGMPQRFVGNGKYLFLYAANAKKDDDVRVVWISRDKRIVKELQEQGYPAFYWLSWRGRYYALRAGYYITDGSVDVISFWLSGGAKVILIFHGIPLKKVAQDVETGKSLDVSLYRSKGLQKILFRYLLPWRFVKPDYAFTTSGQFQKLFASAFRVPEDKIFITGFPKNDVFLQDVPGSEIGADTESLEKIRTIKQKCSNKKTVMYAPTWRDTGGHFFFEKENDLKTLDAFLEQHNLVFFIKLHPLILGFGDAHERDKERYKNIHFVQPVSDLDALLQYMDILVTDYSSTYFEFLLLDRPIIFFPFDYEKYITEDRPLYFDYDEVTPGPKAFSFPTLMNVMEDIAEGRDDYSWARKKVRDMCFTYPDGKSSARAYERIQSLSHSR